MGVHLRMMNESFFSIHGVPESINISKKPLCQNFHLFFFLQNFFKLYAILTRCQEYITWLVIHQTKPEFVGIHHAKGLRDRSTYKGETRHLKIYTNFWTPCRSIFWRKAYFYSCSALLKSKNIMAIVPSEFFSAFCNLHSVLSLIESEIDFCLPFIDPCCSDLNSSHILCSKNCHLFYVCLEWIFSQCPFT